MLKPKSDSISLSGNLRMNHVLRMFYNCLINSGVANHDSDIGHDFGGVIYYTDKKHASNIAVRRQLHDFIVGHEEAEGGAEFELGNNITLILIKADKIRNLGSEDEQPDFDNDDSTHYTVLNLIRNDDGSISMRYSDSLGSATSYDPIPVTIASILREYGIEPSLAWQEFVSNKQGVTADCGYYAVYHALQMLGINVGQGVKEFVDAQRILLQKEFGVEEEPFTSQIKGYYRGILTQLQDIDEDTLAGVIEQIKECAYELEDDARILNFEENVVSQIENSLREHVLFVMAQSITNVEFDKSELGKKCADIDLDFFGDEPDELWQEYISKLKGRIFDANLWEKTIATRLDLYGRKLIELEQDNINKADEIYSQEDYSEEDRSDDSYYSDRDSDRSDEGPSDDESEEGYDYRSQASDDEDEQQSYSASTASVRRFYTEHKEEFTNPSSFKNLIAIASGFGADNLSWLINQHSEYAEDFGEDDIWPYFIERILQVAEGKIDPDLLSFIIYSATVSDSEDETARLFNSGSLARDYDEEKLIAGRGFIIDSFVNFLDEISLTNLQKDIDRQFAYAADLAKSGDLAQLRASYNAAYLRHDLVRQNQIWSVFGLLQKKLKSLASDDVDVAEVLTEARKDYQKRAESYYFRTYPHHDTTRLIYSAKNPEKVAAVDIAELMGELEEVGRSMNQLLKDIGNNPSDQTNVVDPILCFVISDKAHKKGGDHRRIIIPVSLDFSQYSQALLSRDFGDEVFSESDDFYDLAKADSEHGLQIVRAKTSGAPQAPCQIPDDELAKTFNHSERVLFHALRNRENVARIVDLLRDKLKEVVGGELEAGKYKVYAAALLTYSTHGICQYCSPSIIAHENYFRDSFLTLLTRELNESEDFKTRGSGGAYGSREKRQEEIRRKFHLATIVTCDDTHSEQSKEMSELHLTAAEKQGSVATQYHNPQAKIHLDHDAIDLHQDERKRGKLDPRQHSFYEFVGARFSDREALQIAAPQPNFKFSGKVFMSGSKESKLSQQKIVQLNAVAKATVAARAAVRVVEIDYKGQFVRKY